MEKKKTGKRAYSLLEQIFERINNGSSDLMNHSYANGLAGFSYVVTLLQKEGFIDVELEGKAGRY